MRPLSPRISLALLSALSLSALPSFAADPGPVVPLWDIGAPGFEARRNIPEKIVPDSNGKLDPQSRFIASIHNPSLTLFLPPDGTGTGAGVIVMPGGGHRALAIDHEGYDVGRWLAAHGIAAFVLKYRLAREPGSTYRIEVEAFQDAKRSVRLVRAHAAEWGVDPARVGVMGFSAGGELAQMVSQHPDNGAPDAMDPVERLSCRPAFQALIYPGQSQKIIPTADSPPAFLVCGYDDRTDISQGLADVYLRFKRAGVPAELHIFTGVGHGFGIKPGNSGPYAAWPDRFREWLGDRKLLAQPAS